MRKRKVEFSSLFKVRIASRLLEKRKSTREERLLGTTTSYIISTLLSQEKERGPT